MRQAKPLLLLSALLAAALPARAETSRTIADFDRAAATDAFAFKDEKGSVFNVSAAYVDERRGKHLGVRYSIVADGWGGWGVPLKGFDARGYRYLALDVKGEKGGEVFEVGLRDAAGQEKKFPISRYLDVSSEWREVLVPLTDFAGLNLATLDNFNLGFNAGLGAGRVFIDNVRFTGATGPAAGTLALEPTLVNKALIDGFERTSPADAYRVFQGDESSLTLASSRVVYDGDYAMELEYRFSTTRPWGSWVSAARELRDPLDWTGAQEVKIWVKGDGSENLFRFRFTEADGETWEFVDSDVFGYTRWTLVTMPLSRFELVAPSRTDGAMAVDRVRAYQIDVLSPTSQLSAGSKSALGRVQVDQLYVSGEKLRAAQSAPAGTVPQLRTAVAAIGNVDFSMFAFTEYFFSPEQKSQVNHFVKLITNAKFGNYSARAEFGSQSQEFGNAAAFIGSSVTSTDNRFPAVELPSFQVVANNVSPYVTNVTLGNVFVDYSPYTFSPVFGFKGMTVEGDYDRYNYHAFAIKHVQNSFTTGTRVRGVWPRWKLTGQTVYWEQNARLANASAVSGTTLQTAASTSEVALERVAQDLVYYGEAEGRLLSERVRLQGIYARNEYRQSAEADFTNARDPIFTAPLETSHRPSGDMWRGKLETDGLFWRGLNAAYSYRDVDTAFKPRYRQNPVFFDDTESDQWGHNVRLTQFHKGWVFSNDYDTLRRQSQRSFYRHRYIWAVGYYGYRGMDVAFNQEYRRQVYTFKSDRSAFDTITNEKVIGQEIYFRAQLSPRIAWWIKPRQERIWTPLDNKSGTAEILQTKFDFYMDTNARFFVEHKTTRFRHPDNEPKTFPFDDNFTRVSFEVTF
jgi:hypothetical protein